LFFDGTDGTQTHIRAQKPEGRPTFDTTDPAAVNRFRANKYNISAILTSDELVWRESGRPDFRDISAYRTCAGMTA
jgi:hypothetical protein